MIIIDLIVRVEMVLPPMVDRDPLFLDERLHFQPEPQPSVPAERYDLRIMKALRRILRSVDVYSRKLSAEHGVTGPQLLCMTKLDELGSLTIRELSKEVFLSPSTLVGIIDRLEAGGFVERQRSVRDRRKVRVFLTESGRGVIERSPSPLQDSLGAGIERLPELERATITLALERICELMESHPNLESLPDAAPILETGLPGGEVND